MSKGSKKVISQNELRRIMNEQKSKVAQNVKKIESPLAKYSDKGELRCILCDTPIRSEALWSSHIVSKEHLSNIAAAKKARTAMAEPPATFKRPAPVPAAPPAPSKKPKGILKNAPVPKEIPVDFFDSSIVKQESGMTKIKTEAKSLLPLGQYGSDDEDMEVDEKSPIPMVPSRMRLPAAIDGDNEILEEKSNKQESKTSTEILPEGFFDDPKLDAKIRNVEYRDPVEEEWERFQRAIKEEAEQSQQIIQDEQEEATAERQIDEIDEQMRNWSRVLELERLKDRVKVEPAAEAISIKQVKEEMNSDDDEDFDEFFDWRAKQS